MQASIHQPKLIAITLGDPGGIGTEVALRALYSKSLQYKDKFLLVGSHSLVRSYADFFKFPQPPVLNQPLEQIRDKTSLPDISIWSPPVAVEDKSQASCWEPGKTSKLYGTLAAAWVAAAAKACLAGTCDALVTAPLSKEGLALAGLPFPGHTEYLAHLTRTKTFAMMLMGGPLRVILATRHLPLAKVPASLKTAEIVSTARLALQALTWLDVSSNTELSADLAVCALNPHAGEGGILGKEEIKIITPAIRLLQTEGFSVTGPVPADVVFHQTLSGYYKAVLAMYHDQGLAPLKMLAFDVGINLTLGLPIIRTSPDHGTAFDIAGQGMAGERSMLAAINLASELARRGNPWCKK